LLLPIKGIAAQNAPAPTPDGTTRTYYIAAEEIDWNYIPDGKDMMMTRAFDPYARVFTEHATDRIGCTYHKAVFREYTDDTFRTLKPRPPELEHMGLLGPVIRAEVGDTIKVVFRNNANFPFSLHPHGVAYTRDSEGAMYGDGWITRKRMAWSHLAKRMCTPGSRASKPDRDHRMAVQWCGSTTRIITSQKT
jgi:hephaestin